MALQTTVIALSTTPVVLISTGTTWANTLGASLYDPVPFLVVNESTVQPVRIGGTTLGISGTTGSGLPLAVAGGALSYNLLASDRVVAWTTASTGSVTVQAGRN